MPRNGDDARRRLQQAALELFLERGYEQTTAAQIAERAGVTERTFFRHFPDKREVLFDGGEALRAALVEAMARAPQDLPPLAAIAFAFHAARPLFEANRPFTAPARRLFAATPALRERELAKAASLIAALSEALIRRGVDPAGASLAAQIGMAATSQAVSAWLDDDLSDFDERLGEAFARVAALVGARPA